MIIWLASYPKSGNTYVRAFLSAYYFSENGQFAIGIGLGMSFERYNTNVIRTNDFNSNVSYSVSKNLADNPFFFSLQSLELPLSIRWRNSSSKDYEFWRIYGGIAFQWNYRIHAKTEDMSFSVSMQLLQTRTHFKLEQKIYF